MNYTQFTSNHKIPLAITIRHCYNPYFNKNPGWLPFSLLTYWQRFWKHPVWIVLDCALHKPGLFQPWLGTELVIQTWYCTTYSYNTAKLLSSKKTGKNFIIHGPKDLFFCFIKYTYNFPVVCCIKDGLHVHKIYFERQLSLFPVRMWGTILLSLEFPCARIGNK